MWSWKPFWLVEASLSRKTTMADASPGYRILAMGIYARQGGHLAHG
jgi:hypothetical protein